MLPIYLSRMLVETGTFFLGLLLQLLIEMIVKGLCIYTLEN
jgi:hypothetical protein